MATQEPTLKQALYEILHGLQSERNLRETREGLVRLREAFPGVAESVARGAIASVPGSVGDISEFARSVAPETMESTFGRRVAPTTREILDYVPRITPTHEGASTLEDVGAAISPGVGGVTKDIAIPAAKAYGKFVGPTVYNKLEDFLIKTGGIQQLMTGPESKLWNKEMAFNARKLEAKGETPEQIFDKTGMVRGLDGQWRQEISDKYAFTKGTGTYGQTVMDRMTALGKDKTAEPVTLEDIFYHPTLAKSYPELMNTEVQFTAKGNKNRGELVHTDNGYIIRLNPELSADEAKSTLLHEIQHSIQGQEGWNRGANYQEILKKYDAKEQEIEQRLREANRALSKSVGTPDYEKLMQVRDEIGKEYRDFIGVRSIGKLERAFQEYKNYGGEAESRLVQNRLNLSDEDLKKHFPYQFAPEKHGLDINPDEAIITTQHPRSINIPSQEYDFSKIPTLKEYEEMVGKGQMRQARTFDQDLKDTLKGKVPGNIFEIPMEHSVNYESGFFTKKLEKAGLHVYDDKYGTVYVGKTPQDLEFIKNAKTPIEHGLSYGYTPEDIAKFYTNRRGGRSDIGYAEYIDDLKHVQNKYPSSLSSYEYRGSHKAPGNDDYHSPAHELDRGMYPSDVYGPMGHHYYGEGDRMNDRAVLKILNEARGNPDHPITVYRAVPAEFKDQDINPGDWVTPTLDYAHKHGLRFDSHHIIEKTVPAKHLWSEGNSLHEFGYDPTE